MSLQCLYCYNNPCNGKLQNGLLRIKSVTPECKYYAAEFLSQGHCFKKKKKTTAFLLLLSLLLLLCHHLLLCAPSLKQKPATMLSTLVLWSYSNRWLIWSCEVIPTDESCGGSMEGAARHGNTQEGWAWVAWGLTHLLGIRGGDRGRAAGEKGGGRDGGGQGEREGEIGGGGRGDKENENVEEYITHISQSSIFKWLRGQRKTYIQVIIQRFISRSLELLISKFSVVLLQQVLHVVLMFLQCTPGCLHFVELDSGTEKSNEGQEKDPVPMST